ncbi:hypothetical protein ACFLYB_06445, partial [Chloroflexota bacterium]
MRHCSLCNLAILHNENIDYCSACMADIIQGITDRTKVYTFKDMMKLLDLHSEEQVRRHSRQGKIPGRIPIIKQHLFVRTVVDKWIEHGQPTPRAPNPLQKEARILCNKKDHSWLMDEKYNGVAYFSAATIPNNTRPNTSIRRPLLGYF